MQRQKRNLVTQTDPIKIASVKTWPVPKHIKSLRFFLGLTWYYRRFVKDYAKLVRPLNDLWRGHLTIRNQKHIRGRRFHGYGVRQKKPCIWLPNTQINITSNFSLCRPFKTAYCEYWCFKGRSTSGLAPREDCDQVSATILLTD